MQSGWRWVLSVFAVVALVSACGGGGDDDDDATDEATDASEEATDGGGEAGGDFCDQAADIQELVAAGGEDSLSDEGFAQLEELADAFEEIEPPEEVADDWEANLEGLRELIRIVGEARDAGVDENTPPDDPQVEELFTQLGELDTSASERVISFLEEECDLGTGEGGGDGDASGPIAFEDLLNRCEELTDIATSLRGEEPTEVETDQPPEPRQVSSESNGVEASYEEADCRFTYEGDRFETPNRVRLGVRRAEGGDALEGDDLAAAYGTCAEGEVPFGEEVSVDGVGDEACFRNEVSFDAESQLVARVGDQIVYVVVSVPEELGDSPFLELEPVTTAALDFLERLET